MSLAMVGLAAVWSMYIIAIGGTAPAEPDEADADPRCPPETAISRDGHSVHSVTDGSNESPLIAVVFEEDVVIPATSALFSSFGADPAS
jgi:hypothetical protein